MGCFTPRAYQRLPSHIPRRYDGEVCFWPNRARQPSELLAQNLPIKKCHLKDGFRAIKLGEESPALG